MATASLVISVVALAVSVANLVRARRAYRRTIRTTKDH